MLSGLVKSCAPGVVLAYTAYAIREAGDVSSLAASQTSSARVSLFAVALVAPEKPGAVWSPGPPPPTPPVPPPPVPPVPPAVPPVPGPAGSSSPPHPARDNDTTTATG